MGLFLQDPTLDDLVSRYGERAEEYHDIYKEFVSRMRTHADAFLKEFQTQRIPATLQFVQEIQKADLTKMTDEGLVDYALNILEHNRTQSYVDFVNCARLGFYYSQRLQDLLHQDLGAGKEEAIRLFSILNQGLEGSAINDSNIAIARCETEEEALRVASELVGHFSSGEMLEIRHVPMRDDHDRLVAYVRGIRQSGNYVETIEKQRHGRKDLEKSILEKIASGKREEMAHVMWASQTYMAGRETAKYYFTKEYLHLRDALELLGKRKGLGAGDIYHLYPRELKEFVQEPKSLLHLVHSRKQSFENYAHLEMPSIILEHDIGSLDIYREKEGVFTQGIGKFLADGPTVSGVVVNIDDYPDLSALNDVMADYQRQSIPVIIAAKQMNLSHDPIIEQSAGLIIKNAGLVAHGAQRARELGKGAIGGVDTRLLKTGMEILFDPTNRSITNLACNEG